MNQKINFPTVDTAQEAVEQPTLYLNWHMELEDGRILNNDYLRLVEFSGQEQLSNPFTFTLSLHGNSDNSKATYSFAELIGQAVTIGVCIKDPKQGVDNGPFDDSLYQPANPASDFVSAMAGEQSDNFTFYNGMVTAFSMSEPGVYSLTMKPSLWRLMLTNDYKIHEQLSIRTAIESLMTKHKIEFNTNDLVGNTNAADYRIQDWLQAGESDFELLQRLLSKANIHFYFVHGPNSHKIVFSNKMSYPATFHDERKLKYCYSRVEGVENADTLLDYSYSQNISSTNVVGCVTRQEEAWESDTVAGECSFYTDSAAKDSDLPLHIYKIVQYGGSKSWVDMHSSQVAQMADSAATELNASTHCPEIRVGHKIQLEEGEHSGPPSVNPYLDQSWFVVTEAQHQASLDGTYTCKFKATEADSLITTFNAHDTHQGSVLAEVMAHCHGDMPTTWKYYEKTVYDPENSKATDLSASNSGFIGGIDPSDNPNPQVLVTKGIFVRFTSSPNSDPVFVKLSASMQTCPEIGSMVIVARASDDSELPEVQQSVQANGSKVITPSGWKADSHVGNSYSTSYSDSKSIRFSNNKNYSKANLDEAIKIITKEYDKGVFRDSSYSKGGSYSYSTSESDRSGMLSTSDSFGNTFSHHEGDISKSYSDISSQFSKSLNETVVSKSKITESSDNHHVNEGSSTSYSEVLGKTTTTNIQGEVESHNTTKGTVNSTSTFEDEVTDTSTHKKLVTSHSTYEGDVDSHSTNEGNVTNTSDISGTETNNITRNAVITHSKTSTSTGTNMVGASANLSLLGASADTSISGARVSMAVSATTNDMNITGIRNSISVTGLANSISLTGTGFSFESSEVLTVQDTLGAITLQEFLLLV